jgi:hypothetical protein
VFETMQTGQFMTVTGLRQIGSLTLLTLGSFSPRRHAHSESQFPSPTFSQSTCTLVPPCMLEYCSLLT